MKNNNKQLSLYESAKLYKHLENNNGDILCYFKTYCIGFGVKQSLFGYLYLQKPIDGIIYNGEIAFETLHCVADKPECFPIKTPTHIYINNVKDDLSDYKYANEYNSNGRILFICGELNNTIYSKEYSFDELMKYVDSTITIKIQQHEAAPYNLRSGLEIAQFDKDDTETDYKNIILKTEETIEDNDSIVSMFEDIIIDCEFPTPKKTPNKSNKKFTKEQIDRILDIISYEFCELTANDDGGIEGYDYFMDDIENDLNGIGNYKQ